MALPVAAFGTGYATLWALCAQRDNEPTLCIYRARNLGRRFTGPTSTLTKSVRHALVEESSKRPPQFQASESSPTSHAKLA
jgi:hypothetical protein